VACNFLGFIDLSDLNSAHNGYLQIYLDLGMVGVCLIGVILIRRVSVCQQGISVQSRCLAA